MSMLKRLKTRYYVPSPEDSLPEKLWKSATRRRAPDFPRTVQIQTMTGCNAACVFCPYPLTVDSQPKGFMKKELFEQIIDEIAAHGVRRISPYLMNEPFLDPSMPERLLTIKGKIPDARLVVTTNGSRLTPVLVDKLLDLNVLHALYISFQGVEKEGYEATMKGSLVFERTLENVLTLIEKWKAAGGRERFKIVVTMVNTNKIDAEKAVAFWRSKGVESKWTALENRGGNIAIARDLAPGDKPMKRFADCTRLFKQAYIMFNGDMVLCCTDYTRKVVLGNIAGSSIASVWNSKKALSVRRLYSEGHMDRIPLCKDCEISNTTGDEEFD
jgi:radical SAM protein with 4Fe4S-binding SPASM domain